MGLHKQKHASLLTFAALSLGCVSATAPVGVDSNAGSIRGTGNSIERRRLNSETGFFPLMNLEFNLFPDVPKSEIVPLDSAQMLDFSCQWKVFANREIAPTINPCLVIEPIHISWSFDEKGSHPFKWDAAFDSYTVDRSEYDEEAIDRYFDQMDITREFTYPYLHKDPKPFNDVMGVRFHGHIEESPDEGMFVKLPPCPDDVPIPDCPTQPPTQEPTALPTSYPTEELTPAPTPYFDPRNNPGAWGDRPLGASGSGVTRAGGPAKDDTDPNNPFGPPPAAQGSRGFGPPADDDPYGNGLDPNGNDPNGPYGNGGSRVGGPGDGGSRMGGPGDKGFGGDGYGDDDAFRGSSGAARSSDEDEGIPGWAIFVITLLTLLILIACCIALVILLDSRKKEEVVKEKTTIMEVHKSSTRSSKPEEPTEEFEDEEAEKPVDVNFAKSGEPEKDESGVVPPATPVEDEYNMLVPYVPDAETDPLDNSRNMLVPVPDAGDPMLSDFESEQGKMLDDSEEVNLLLGAPPASLPDPGNQLVLRDSVAASHPDPGNQLVLRDSAASHPDPGNQLVLREN